MEARPCRASIPQRGSIEPAPSPAFRPSRRWRPCLGAPRLLFGLPGVGTPASLSSLCASSLPPPPSPSSPVVSSLVPLAPARSLASLASLPAAPPPGVAPLPSESGTGVPPRLTLSPPSRPPPPTSSPRTVATPLRLASPPPPPRPPASPPSPLTSSSLTPTSPSSRATPPTPRPAPRTGLASPSSSSPVASPLAPLTSACSPASPAPAPAASPAAAPLGAAPPPAGGSVGAPSPSTPPSPSPLPSSPPHVTSPPACRTPLPPPPCTPPPPPSPPPPRVPSRRARRRSSASHRARLASRHSASSARLRRSAVAAVVAALAASARDVAVLGGGGARSPAARARRATSLASATEGLLPPAPAIRCSTASTGASKKLLTSKLTSMLSRPPDLRLSLAHRGLQPRLRLVAAAAAAQPAAALVLDQQPVLLPRPRRPTLGLQHSPHAAQATILNVLQPACEDARLHLPAQPRLALCRRRRRLRPCHRSHTRPQRLCPTHVVLHPPQPRRVMLLYVRVDLAPSPWGVIYETGRSRRADRPPPLTTESPTTHYCTVQHHVPIDPYAERMPRADCSSNTIRDSRSRVAPSLMRIAPQLCLGPRISGRLVSYLPWKPFRLCTETVAECCRVRDSTLGVP